MIKKITNPFLYLSDKQLYIVAIASILAGMIVSIFLDVKFDGCLDLHFAAKVTLVETLRNIATSVLTLSIILFLAGKVANSKTRFVDILIVVLVSRIALYIIAFQNLGGYGYAKTSQMQALLMHAKGNISVVAAQLQDFFPFLIFTSIFSLLGLILFLSILYNGYKTATNLKSNKHIFMFIAAVIAAEIISKIIFNNF